MIKTLIVSFLGVSSVRAAQAFYPSSHTRLCQLTDFPSSHTRLRQLADFPSLNLRLNKR